MNLELLYQDQHYIAAIKPAGLLIHAYPEKCGEQDTMLRRLRDQTGHYLYPVHRLDRPVSGVILFGLESEAVKKIKDIWSSNLVTKEYTALCRGQITEAGIYNFPLKNDNGVAQDALTRYWPLENFSEETLIKIQIDTGRRHQIRRHFGRRSHNIIGDVKHGHGATNRRYREQYQFQRIFLHASTLTFIHPYTEKRIELHSPLPQELVNLLKQLSK